MAYIFDPIRNTYIDDEDQSLGNKLALSEDIEKIIKQIDDQFGPGTVFPASELPPKENPYKDFEDRNPAANGGMIGGGIIQGEDFGSREGFNRPKLIIPGLEEKIIELFGKNLSNNQVLQELNKIPEYKDVTIGVVKRIKKENNLGGQKEAEALSQEKKYNKLKRLVEDSNKKLKFVDMRTLREQAQLPRKEAPSDKLNLEKFNVPKLDTAKDKISKAFNRIINNPDISVEKVFDLSSTIAKQTGLANSTASEVLNTLPEYEDFIPVRDILSKPASKAKLIADIKSGKEITLGDVIDMVNQKPISGTSLSGSNTPERFIINSVKRHIAQGGNKIQWVKAPGTFDKSGMVTDANAIFKYKGKNYSYYDLLQKGRNLKDFKEVYKTFDDMNDLLSRETIDPVTKQKISFKQLMQKAYNIGANFKSTGNPYEVDHFGSVKDSPFSNLRILPYRINRVQGALFNKAAQVEAGVLKPETAEMYTPEKIKASLQKSGYNFTKDINQLFNDEIKLANDILIKNRKLKTPIQIGKELQQKIETPTLKEKIQSGASTIKSKMDASRMLTSKIPGGAIALTPLDFTMSMLSGVPLTDAAASAGSYLLKDPALGRAVNIPLALRSISDYDSAEEMIQRATERREKGEEFLQGLLEKIKEGAGDQPEISPFQAADGGRVGFEGGGAVGADDNFAKELEYYFTNPDSKLPEMQTFKETMNPITYLNDMIDPRNYPYYADILARSGVRVAEFGARILPALGKLASDLIQKPAFKVVDADSDYVQDYNLPGGNLFVDEFDMMDTGKKKTLKGTGIFTQFLENITPTSMEKKLGLDKLIEAEKQKMIDRGSTSAPVALGETVGLGVELAAPIFPGVKFFQSYAKARNLPANDVTKQIMEKEIDEVLSAKGTDRREFLKVSGAGGAVILAKMLGFGDDFARVAKVAEKTAVKTANVGGKPVWFDALVTKVIREGDDITKQAATKDRETVHAMKLGEQEGVRVTQDLETGNIVVEYESPTNMGNDVVTLSYRAPEQLENGITVPAKFEAIELEPRGIRMGPDDYDIDFDGENIVDGIEDLNSDVSSLKQYATGSLDETDLKIRQEKLKKVQDLNENQVSQAEYLETKYGPGGEGDPYYQDFSDYD